MKKAVIAILGIVILLALIIFGLAYLIGRNSPSRGGKDCVVDNDCLVYGQTGDCNCGCYHKDNLPTSPGGECFCLAPIACRCVEGQCEDIFEQEAPPEEPLEDICDGMALEEAKAFAIESECGDRLKETYFCNSDTKTWWIDLDIEKAGCFPACVIHTETGEAEINWRCTGLISQ